jgi:steroid delta-isomerase-like uncharacterized protein
MADDKSMVQEFYDALSAGTDIDAAIDRYVAEDFVEHERWPGMEPTREIPRQGFKMMRAAMPDFAITVHEMLQDGDKVVVRATFSGTHQAEFMGLPPSGERVEIPVIDIHQVRGGKLVGHWGVSDMSAVMGQPRSATDSS